MSTRLAALLAAACLAVAVSRSFSGGGPSLEGQRFPDLEFRGLDGSVTTMHALAGRVVVVNFWATWCAPCRAEMDSLEQLARLTDATRVAVIGVSVDADVNLVREHVARRGWSFARFIERERSRSRDLLGIDALPRTFVIAPDGRIAMVVTGARDWGTPQMLERIRTLEARRPQNVDTAGLGAASSQARTARGEGLAELAVYGRLE